MSGRFLALYWSAILGMAGATGAMLLPIHPGLGVAGSAVMAALTAFVLYRRDILRREQSLHAIADAMRQLARGDHGFRLFAGGSPALAQLGRSTNEAIDSVARRGVRLEDEQRQLRAILEGLVEGVVCFDAEQRVLFANARAGDMLGFSSGQFAGRKFWEVVRHRPLRELGPLALDAPEPIRMEIDLPEPNGRRLAVYANQLAGGSARGAILVLQDMSELRRLERVRQEFVANVSHELKTPLSVIKLCTETLLDGALEDPRHAHNFLEQIDEQADRLHALILDLLSLARIEAGSDSLECQALELAEIVLDAVERHRSRAEAKGQALRAETRGPPATAWADLEALGTILDNLIDNAIKYTLPGGTITVRQGVQDEAAVLEVHDTGIGIPERDLPRVFERFYRVDKARSRELGGTGLGLSIVKHLAQNQRGTVSVTSHVHVGSCFTVRLPLASQVGNPDPPRARISSSRD